MAGYVEVVYIQTALWEIADTDDRPLSRIQEEYFLGREVEAVCREVTDLDEYADERRDLRDVSTYAVDPAGAQDRDDAFAIQREYTDGDLDGYTAWVHIADVPQYIDEESVIDTYAERQGFTIYDVDDAEHMLPEEIVSEIGFVEREDRLANTVELSFDADGTVDGYDIYPSVVNVDRTMSYDAADHYVGQPKNAPWLGDHGEDLVQRLEDAAFLSMKLAEAGDRNRGSRSTAHRIVEEFMIKANEIGANELFAAGKGLYRVHVDPPGRQTGTAQYSLECKEHDGLNADMYAHLTSPIRRYTDLVNWRILRDETERTEDDLNDLASHLNTQETRIKNREIDALLENTSDTADSPI